MNMQHFTKLATFVALGLVSLPLQAATITVNSTAQENPSVVNGNCTLGEAVTAAKTNAAVDACPAGDATDTIVLAAGATYTLTSNPGDIWAFDLDNLTLEGNGATIERSSADGTPAFSLFDCTGTVTLNKVTLRNGRIAEDSALGGSIRNSGTLTLQSVTIENSYANLSAGAISNQANTTLQIFDSRLLNNTTGIGANGGGAVFNRGTMTVRRSTFRGNKAIRGGAIANWGILGVSDSTFDDNFAKLDGAAIYTVVADGLAGSTTISNSTITNHTSLNGITITNDTGGQTTIINSTIAGNKVAGLNHVTGTVTVQNTLLANNTGGPCSGGTITSAGNNLVDAAPQNCAFPFLDTDLTSEKITTLGLGTFTDTGTAGRGYFPLLSGSQAINAGNSTVCIDDSANNKPDLDQDQLGHARVGACDIGAIEASCGDSVVHANLNEACDDGNTTAGDGCSATCTVESGFACGDGVVAGAEQCDGAALAGATCASVTPATPAGTLACKADCTLDTTPCTTTPETEPEPKSEPDPSSAPEPVPAPAEPTTPAPAAPVAEPAPAPAPAEGGGGCSLVVR